MTLLIVHYCGPTVIEHSLVVVDLWASGHGASSYEQGSLPDLYDNLIANYQEGLLAYLDGRPEVTSSYAAWASSRMSNY